MTHDEKKAALVAAGYKFFAYGSSEEVHTPDGWHFETAYHYGNASEWWSQFKDAKLRLIDTAYAHWQRAQELVALRRFVWDMWSTAKRMRGTEPSLTIFTQADSLIKQFNITDDTEESNAP